MVITALDDSLQNKLPVFSTLWKNIAMWICTFNAQKYIHDSMFFHEVEKFALSFKFIYIVVMIFNLVFLESFSFYW